MRQKTVTVKNRTIILPKTLQKSWENARVFVRASRDTVILKKIQPSSFWDTWQKIKSIKPRLSKRDINQAAAWARKTQT